MKKVIFVCLLTLSVCFSQPTEQSSQASTKLPLVKPGDQNSTVVTPPPASQGGAQNNTATGAPGQSTASPTAPTTAPITSSPTPSIPTKPTTVTLPPETTTHGNETGTTATTTTTTTTTSPVKPDDHKPTSEAPPVPKPATSVVQARGFDGASFVGGIILTLGLIAIGFMGLKYYRAQTERNYHTL